MLCKSSIGEEAMMRKCAPKLCRVMERGIFNSVVESIVIHRCVHDGERVILRTGEGVVLRSGGGVMLHDVAGVAVLTVETVAV